MRVLLLTAPFLLAFAGAMPLWGQGYVPGSMVIIDANDTVVGPVVEFSLVNTNPAVDDLFFAVGVDDDVVMLRLHNTSFNPGYLRSLYDNFLSGPYWESADCSGQAYVGGESTDPNSSMLSRPGTPTQDPGLTVWVPEDGMGEVPYTINSLLGSDGVCQQLGPFSASGVPAVAVPTPFTAPFRVGVAPASAQAPATLSVPAVSPLGLGALALALVAVGVWAMRRVS